MAVRDCLNYSCRAGSTPPVARLPPASAIKVQKVEMEITFPLLDGSPRDLHWTVGMPIWSKKKRPTWDSNPKPSVNHICGQMLEENPREFGDPEN